MKIPCEIDNVKTLKKGAKITLSVDEKFVKSLLQNISGFMDMPLTVELLTDVETQKERLNQISPDQRKKIYAIIKDISEYTGNGLDNDKETMKQYFCSEKQLEMFSLADCKTETAGEFINWLIEFSFEHGIPLSENPIEGNNDIESYVKICIKKKKCCVCGADGKVYNGSNDAKIPLCEIHAHKLKNDGFEKFKDTFHVWGVAI